MRLGLDQTILNLFFAISPHPLPRPGYLLLSEPSQSERGGGVNFMYPSHLAKNKNYKQIINLIPDRRTLLELYE